jgi:hypothetical protein
VSRDLEVQRFEMGEVKELSFQKVQHTVVGKGDLSPPTATINLSLSVLGYWAEVLYTKWSNILYSIQNDLSDLYIPRRNGYRVDNIRPVSNASVIIVITHGNFIIYSNIHQYRYGFIC